MTTEPANPALCFRFCYTVGLLDHRMTSRTVISLIVSESDCLFSSGGLLCTPALFHSLAHLPFTFVRHILQTCGISVLFVLTPCYPFEIFNPIISFYPVSMVYYLFVIWVWNERQSNQAMNLEFLSIEERNSLITVLCRFRLQNMTISIFYTSLRRHLINSFIARYTSPLFHVFKPSMLVI